MRFLTTFSSGTARNIQLGPAPGGACNTTSPSSSMSCRQPNTVDHQAPSEVASCASIQISSNVSAISRLPLAPVLARSSLRSSLAFVFGALRQLLLEDFAHRVARQAVHQPHLPGSLVHRKLLGDEFDQRVRIDVADDEGHDALSQVIVGEADDRHLVDAGVALQRRFDLAGTDPEAA